jgi:hypothetical protein
MLIFFTRERFPKGGLADGTDVEKSLSSFVLCRRVCEMCLVSCLFVAFPTIF